MMNDFVRSYIKFKIKRLSELASFFFNGYNEELINKWLASYFETYTNTYYYNILATLDDAEIFDLNTVQLEFLGIKEDLLDEYNDYELSVENIDYEKHKMAISDMVDICLFICKVDTFVFSSKDNIYEEFIELINNYPGLKLRLGDNLGKLITKLKESYVVEEKIFSDANSYFLMDYSQELKKGKLYNTKLKHNIKILESNYKRSMVERVYSDDRFTIEKIRNSFFKLPRDIMRKFIKGEKLGKYIIMLDDKVFQRGNIDLFRMIDNPFLKRYLVIGVSFNSYAYHKDFLEYLGFKYACYQDLSHISEVLDKLNSIDAEKFFSYILVTDYKDKEKALIQGYECSEDLELYITKED